MGLWTDKWHSTARHRRWGIPHLRWRAVECHLWVHSPIRSPIYGVFFMSILGKMPVLHWGSTVYSLNLFAIAPHAPCVAVAPYYSSHCEWKWCQVWDNGWEDGDSIQYIPQNIHMVLVMFCWLWWYDQCIVDIQAPFTNWSSGFSVTIFYDYCVESRGSISSRQDCLACSHSPSAQSLMTYVDRTRGKCVPLTVEPLMYILCYYQTTLASLWWKVKEI